MIYIVTPKKVIYEKVISNYFFCPILYRKNVISSQHMYWT